MITFELSCEQGHRFEGWFANREAFEEQLSQKLIACPLCDSHQIAKRPSPVAVHTSRHGDAPAARPGAAPGREAHPQGGDVGRALGATLRQIADFVEKQFEDVGGKFASEALRMKQGEIESRAIRGTTTPAEEESLREEGVDFVKIALPKYDA